MQHTRAVGVFVLFCALGAAGQPMPNYVRTTIKNVDGKGADVVSTVYTDGLGRTLQSVARVIDSTGKPCDVISGALYDELGRPYRQTKPFVVKADNLHPAASAKQLIDSANAWYNGSRPDRPNAGNYAFSETRYYDDPLGRVKSTRQAGALYHTTDSLHGEQWQFGVKRGACNLDADSDNETDAQGFLPWATLRKGYRAVAAELDGYKPGAEGATHILSVSMDEQNQFAQSLTDAFGNTVATRSYNGGQPVTATYEYDILGNLLKENPPDNSTLGSTTYRYNTLGQMIFKKSPDADSVSYTYDAAGRLICMTQGPLANPVLKLRYLYDVFGRQTHVLEHNLQGQVAVRVMNVYDDALQAQRVLDGSAMQALMGADALRNLRGRLVCTIGFGDEGAYFGAQIKYDGSVVLPPFSIDSAYAQAVVELFSYDDEGRVEKRLLSVPGLPIHEYLFSYDIHGKTTRTEFRTHPSSVVEKLNYSYDVNGRLKELWYNDSLKARYIYGTSGTLLAKQAFGKNVQLLNEKYGYTIQGWLDYKAHAATTGKYGLFGERLYFSPAGIIEQARYLHTTTLPLEKDIYYQYSYDDLNRLTKVRTKYSPSENYNPSLRKSRLDADYAYDDNGRFVTKYEEPNIKGLGTYIYKPGTNQLKSILDSTHNHANNFIYDARGNMVLDRSKKMAIQYNWRNLPITFKFYAAIPAAVTTAADVAMLDKNNQATLKSYVQMLYDAAGNRVLKDEYLAN